MKLRQVVGGLTLAGAVGAAAMGWEPASPPPIRHRHRRPLGRMTPTMQDVPSHELFGSLGSVR
jgi:hypothetical protein